MSSRILCLAVIVGVFSICMSAQTAPAAPAPQAPSRTSSMFPSSYTNPSSGKEVFDVVLCASCYGKDGKGDGPAAPALKMPDGVAANEVAPSAVDIRRVGAIRRDQEALISGEVGRRSPFDSTKKGASLCALLSPRTVIRP